MALTSNVEEKQNERENRRPSVSHDRKRAEENNQRETAATNEPFD
jgi:hypothetical protein